MNIQIQTGVPLDFAAPCLLLPIWADEPLTGPAAALDQKLGGLVAEIIAGDGFKAAIGDTRVMYPGENAAAGRVILLGLGKKAAFSTSKLRHAVAKGARAARSLKKASFALALPRFSEISSEEAALGAAEGITLGLHVFNDFKTDKDKPTEIESAAILVEGDLKAARRGGETARILSDASLRARALVNAPSNLKTPEFIATAAREMAAEKGLKCEVWDEKRILDEKMGALYAVGMGSENPARFIVLEYVPRGLENEAPLALVGKGMSFDTGGYSLKPSTSMEDMKDDMAGAAAVLGAMSALADLKITRRVLGVIPSAENMISGRAQRPGDIVTARNGKTIEVLNTDAEGRLILADALSWVSEQKPAAIIDLATLTGAIGIALGQEAAGIFSNDDALANALLQSGEKTGERLWRFPIWEEYRDYMKGTISDLKNIGPERRAGSIAGAIFLENFVEKGIPWAHLDIAAVALLREDRPLTARGATGFGARLLLDYLRNS